MLSRGLVSAAAVVVVLCASGVGYAMCTTGGQGQVDLVWHGLPSATPTAICSASSTSTVLTVTVVKMAPGSACTIDGTLLNDGNLAGTLSSSIQITWPSTCLSKTVSGYAFSDDIGPHGPTLNVDKTYGFVGVLSLSASAGNGCELSKAVITDTITLTKS